MAYAKITEIKWDTAGQDKGFPGFCYVVVNIWPNRAAFDAVESPAEIQDFRMQLHAKDATARTTRSSLKAHKSSNEPPPRPTIKTSNRFNPKKQASVGTNNFQALPYFFNIASLNDLNFTWSSDGKPIAGAPVNPSILNLNIASEGAPVETKMRIAAFIQNIKNPIEAATGNTTIIVK